MPTKTDIKQVSFQNKTSDSLFDIVKIEDLHGMENLDHSPYNFHQIDFYMLVLFTEGTGSHGIDFNDYEHSKGTLLSIRKDQIHKFSKTNSKGYLLLFTDDFLISYIEKKEVSKCFQLFNELINSPKIQLSDRDFEEILLLVHKIKEEYFEVHDEQSTGIICSLLYILISKIYRLKSTENITTFNKKYLSEFITLQTLVETNCFATKKVNDYADLMSVSSKTLNNITNSILHKPAKKFINEIFITKIKRLLINTNLSIKEIAYQCGFEETTNFYTFFKKTVLTTPETFRNSHK